jgi:hypothetical protein
LEKKENVVENDAEEKNDVVEKEDFKEKKEYFGGDSGEGECCGE